MCANGSRPREPFLVLLWKHLNERTDPEVFSASDTINQPVPSTKPENQLRLSQMPAHHAAVLLLSCCGEQVNVQQCQFTNSIVQPAGATAKSWCALRNGKEPLAPTASRSASTKSSPSLRRATPPA